MTREEIEMIRERCFATDEDFVKVLSETVSHKDMLKARREYHSVTHEEFVSYLRERGKAKIFDLNELLKLYFCENTDDIIEEDDHDNIYISVWFDADKALGLDSEDSEDWISLYIDWYKESQKFNMYLIYCDNSTDGDDFQINIEMAPEEEAAIRDRVLQLYAEGKKKTFNVVATIPLEFEIEATSFENAVSQLQKVLLDQDNEALIGKGVQEAGCRHKIVYAKKAGKENEED